MFFQKRNQAVVQLEMCALIEGILSLAHGGLQGQGLLARKPLLVDEVSLLHELFVTYQMLLELAIEIVVRASKHLCDGMRLLLDELGRFLHYNWFHILDLLLKVDLVLRNLLLQVLLNPRIVVVGGVHGRHGAFHHAGSSLRFVVHLLVPITSLLEPRISHLAAELLPDQPTV